MNKTPFLYLLSPIIITLIASIYGLLNSNLIFLSGDSSSFLFEIYERDICNKPNNLIYNLYCALPSLNTIGYIYINVILISLTFIFINLFSSKKNSITFLLLSPVYFLLAFTPNKEILILFLFSLYVFSLSYWKNYIICGLISIIIFKIRDGFALFMIAFLLFYIFMNKKEITLNNNFSFKLKLVVLSIFLILILNSAIFLIDELLLSSRFQILIEKKINSPYSPSSIFGYIYRIIGNSTNLLFRNPFITENNEINLLSITYFFSGLIFLYSILDSILKFFICENFLRHYLFLSSIALLNLTPYIQPRYFIPLILLYIAFNRENTFENLVIWLIIIMISALCVTTQIILGIYPTI